MALATRPKPKVHHRKRQAQHHRRSKHYNKPYWPYLPMLLIVGLGLMINLVWSQGNVLGTWRDFSSPALLEATNEQRATQHAGPLSIDPQLSAAAQAKADDMVANDYWAHTAPDGKTAWSFIAESGYQYQLAGENLAYGFDNPGDTITGWMNSPEHRDNILNPDYSNVGFGVASSPDFLGRGPQIIIVAEYARPVDAAAHITFSVLETATNATSAGEVHGAASELDARPVARIQLLTGGQAAWTLAVFSAVAGAALALFVTRHGFRIHRAITRGERFIAHHPYLDIAIVLVIVTGFVLTRTSGIIR